MSGRNDWGTPKKYFDLIQRLFGPMDVDVCAHKDNTKVKEFYFTKEVNGLLQDWTRFSRLWMNPPFSEDVRPGQKKGKPVIQDWLQKAHESTRGRSNVTVFALVPNDPSTKWWMNFGMQAKHILFNCGGRLKFDDQKGSPTFTTALLIYSMYPIKYAGKQLPLVGFLDFKKGTIL